MRLVLGVRHGMACEGKLGKGGRDGEGGVPIISIHHCAVDNCITLKKAPEHQVRT